MMSHPPRHPIGAHRANRAHAPRTHSTSMPHAPLPEPSRATRPADPFAQLVGALQALDPVVDARTPDDGRREEDLPAEEALVLAEAHAHAGRLRECLRACERLLKRPEVARDDRLAGIATHVQALALQYAGRMTEALGAGYRALERLRSTPLVARALRLSAMQAQLLARVGMQAEAREHLAYVLDTLPVVPDMPARERASTWINVAAARHELAEAEASMAASRAALDVLRDAPHEDLAAIAETNLAAAELGLIARSPDVVEPARARQAAEAITPHAQALMAAGRAHLAAKIVEDGADALIAMGLLERAEALLQLGVRAARQADAGPERGELEIRLARVARLRGDHRGATLHIATALEMLGQGELPEALAAAWLENSALHEARHRHRAALDCHREYHRLREGILRRQAEARGEALVVRLAAERAAHAAERERLLKRLAELEAR